MKFLRKCEMEASETEYKEKEVKKNDPSIFYIDEQVLMLDP